MYKRYECCGICVFVKFPVAAIGVCELTKKPVFLDGKCKDFIPQRKYKGQTKPY